MLAASPPHRSSPTLRPVVPSTLPLPTRTPVLPVPLGKWRNPSVYAEAVKKFGVPLTFLQPFVGLLCSSSKTTTNAPLGGKESDHD